MPENDQWPDRPDDQDPNEEHDPQAEPAPATEPDPEPDPESVESGELDESGEADESGESLESEDPLTGPIPDEATVPVLPDGDDDPVPGEAVQQLVPALEKTGHEAVDAALAALDDLTATSVQDHPAVFEATHEELRRALNDAAGAPASPPEV